MRNLRQSRKLPNVMYYNGTISSTGQDTADLFASFFESVYSKEGRTVPEFNFNDSLHVAELSVGLAEVFSELYRLSADLSFGPDGIPPVLLKNCVYTLSYPLFKLFNLSLQCGIFPNVWKYSYIQPIYKSGDSQNIENYRGVSLQSAIPKILDKLVTDQLSSLSNGIIVDNQHGFQPRRSTITNLLEYQHCLTQSLEQGCQVDSIYTDYSKAFDRVDHVILLEKLRQMGLQGPLLKWLRSFLVGRYQCVKINNYLSKQFEIPSGVPQGSHCGPLLFILFTNDISQNLGSPHLMFADDLKIFRVVGTDHDSVALQNDLDILSEWSYKNGLHLNPSKCSVMSFTRKKNLHRFIYDIGSENLDRSIQVKDLGVYFDPELNFKNHINIIVARAYQRLGFVLRHCKDFSPDTLRLLYCTYVRPCLEYGSIIWSPYYQYLIQSIERVQNKFLKGYAFKIGLNVSELSYEDRCMLLNFPSLEIRRKLQELVFLHKLVNGNVVAPNLLMLLNFSAPCHTHQVRNRDFFRSTFHRTNYGINNPMLRIQRNFNTNCDLLDLSTSLSSFKRTCISLLSG